MKNRKGFTLVEILAVIAIIGILATVGVISTKAILKNGKKKVFVSSLKEALTSATRYGDDYLNELESSTKTITINEVEYKYIEKSINDLIKEGYEKSSIDSFKHYETDEGTQDVTIIIYKNNNRVNACIPMPNKDNSDYNDFSDNAVLLKEDDNYSNLGNENIYCDIKASVSPSVIEITASIDTEEWAKSKTLSYTIREKEGKSFKYRVSDEKCNDIDWSSINLTSSNVNNGLIITSSIDENGKNYYVCVKNSDGIANEKSVLVKKIDNSKPTIESGELIENKSFKLTGISDIGSGVDKVCLSTINNSSTCTWKDYNGSNREYISAIDLTTIPNSLYVYLYAFVKDKVGNISDVYTITYTKCSKKIYLRTETSECVNGIKTTNIYYNDNVTGGNCIESSSQYCESCTDWQYYSCSSDGWVVNSRTCNGTLQTVKDNTNPCVSDTIEETGECTTFPYIGKGRETVKYYYYGGTKISLPSSVEECEDDDPCSSRYLYAQFAGSIDYCSSYGYYEDLYIIRGKNDTMCDCHTSIDYNSCRSVITPVYDNPTPITPVYKSNQDYICEYIKEMINNSIYWFDSYNRDYMHSNNQDIANVLQYNYGLKTCYDGDYECYDYNEKGYWYLKPGTYSTSTYGNCYLLYSICNEDPYNSNCTYPRGYTDATYDICTYYKKACK